MKRLRRLRAGDRIALVAPASSFPPEEIAAGAAELQRLGFAPVFEESIFDKASFTAGTIQARVNAIHAAWSDPDVAALIAVRGGYGSAQLLPYLDTDLLRRACKALIGYSDITALLNLYVRNGLNAIHGPMIDRRIAKGADGYDEASFRAVLMSDEPPGMFAPEQLETLYPGTADGVLMGGTLTQLTASLGTPWAFDPPAGCVLFIEDVGERPYRVHRMLTQLAQAGSFERCNAVVFGEFPRCGEPGSTLSIREVLLEFTRDFRGPVLFNFPSGHTHGATWTLPFGVRVEVTGRPTPSLNILEPAVA